jgi:hypothetical protein
MIKKFDIVSVVTNTRQEGEGLATVLGFTTFEGEEAAIIQYHFNSCPAQLVCTRFMEVRKQNRIDELELQLKQTVENAISQASVLHDRIDALEAEVSAPKGWWVTSNDLHIWQLEQQAKGIEDAVNKLQQPVTPSAAVRIINRDLLEFAGVLRNKAKALKEQG